MTPKELVLQGYKLFSEGKLEELGKQFAKDAKIIVNGNHEWSGTYNGYNDWLARMLSQVPVKLPGFNLEILNVVSEEDKVFLHVHITAKNIDANAVHMFTVKDGLQTEFRIFDDSQKISKALSG
tara:strand:- start:87 stop:458 length:372 start_codon:yes stop_codon:yes gene_type:complete